MQHEKEFIRLLRKERSYKEEELIKSFHITKKEFYQLCIYILDDRVKKLQFDSDPNRYKYLYKIFKYFDNIEEENSIIYVVRKLKNIRSYCQQVLEKNLKSENKKENPDNILNKIIGIIEVTLMRIDFNQNWLLK